MKKLFLIFLTAFISLQAQDKPDPDRFEIKTLHEDLDRPMTMDVLPDGRIIFVELGGKVRLLNPATGIITDSATIKVTTSQESGLLGVVCDPNFKENNWIYVRYSHPTEKKEYVSRFTLKGDKIDTTKEDVIISFDIDRKKGNCCHKAGSLAFDPSRNLYISVGDNTGHAGASKGFGPLDERPGNDDYDSQRSSANSMSLVGGIMRITPKKEGGYTIPEGNLFPEGGKLKGRPELFTKGNRNPWRISIDPKTGYLYWGEVGPDAGSDDPKKGPRGYDEINQAKQAGFFGWPYFIADNFSYIDRDFVTGEIKGEFDPQKPINDSPNNSGSKVLPPAQPAFIYYLRQKSKKFPMLGSGGRTACAGPVYHYDEKQTHPHKLPKYYDNCLFIYEWSRHWIMAVHLNEDSSIKRIEPFLKTGDIIRPIDIKFGPNGEMYVIRYGETWGKNEDTKMLRIDYVQGNRPPKAVIDYENNIGKLPLKVKLSAEKSFDRDREDKLKYEWFIEGQPQAFSTEVKLEKTFNIPGTHTVTLKVSDQDGLFSQESISVVSGNSTPEVVFDYQAGSGIFDWNEDIKIKVNAIDAEDGKVSKLKLKLSNKEENAAEPLGLRLMKKSDCFNCHAIDRKIVGPTFNEIALKYKNDDKGFNESVKRVHLGSVNVWGPAPMLAHPQHKPEDIEHMIRWIFSLSDKGEELEVNTNEVITLKAPQKNNSSSKFVVLAKYTDKGAIAVGPLTGSKSFVSRHKLVEAEKADERIGLKQKFSHDSGHGNKSVRTQAKQSYLVLNNTLLKGIKSMTLRVTGAQKGTVIEVREDSTKGKLLGKLTVEKNIKAFENLTLPLSGSEKPANVHIIFKQKVARGMYINWLQFNK